MGQRIVLGMGAGQCGLNLLAEILAKQPRFLVTLEHAPLRPWVSRPDRPVIRERFRRWAAADADYVGDVAAFYLPYVKATVEAVPGVRLVCLKRPREEVVLGFCRQLDASRPVPTNH